MEARYSTLEVFGCCVSRIMMFEMSWIVIYRACQPLLLNSLLFNFLGFVPLTNMHTFEGYIYFALSYSLTYLYLYSS